MRIGSVLAALSLAGSAALAASAPPETACEIGVNTAPPGATISVDGNKYGPAPISIPGLSTGAHLVAATLLGHEEARRTVTLLEQEPRTTVDLKMDPILGLVLIRTEPAGADVQIDGADRGKTPMFLADIPIGKYRVKLSIPGYQPKEIDLTIKDRTPQRIVLSMTSDSAKITLNSDPAGADVVLNGLAKGKTPCTVDRIPAGDVRIEMALDGFKPYEQTLKLVAGQEEKLTAVLKPIPAELSVVSLPEKARIYVNDQFRGESPVALKDLAPGSYRVRAELKGHEIEARTVEIKQAAKVVEEFRLSRNCGLMEIVTEPAGVKVMVDGQDCGTTSAKAGEADTVSDPLQVDLLAIGQHQVQLTKKGYFAKALTIDIEKDKTAVLHEPLNRRFIPDCQVSTTSGATFTGVLVEKDNAGNIKLETKPGVIKAIPANEVRTCVPIKEKPDAGSEGNGEGGAK